MPTLTIRMQMIRLATASRRGKPQRAPKIPAKLPMEELIAEAVNSCEKVCACYKEGEGVVFRYPRREGVV